MGTPELDLHIEDAQILETDDFKPEDFLLIEDGSELRKQLNLLRKDLDEQATIFCREIDSLWKLIKDFMRLSAPILLCLVFWILTRFTVAVKHQPMVLSSLLGCVVATMCVYSTPFILSFNRYRKIRHERIKKISSRFIKEGSVRKVDSDTCTTDSDVTRITDSSFSDNVGNAPTSSSSSSNSQESADDLEDQSNFMEVVGAAQMKEPVENPEKFCQDCGDNSTKTCDCCPSK